MIIKAFSNSVNVTERSLREQRMERVERRMIADIESGKRKFWRGLSSCYCMTAAEYGGFLLAADEWDDGKNATGDWYASPQEQTPERRQCIIAQVRSARTERQFVEALDAAYWYDGGLWQNLHRQYAPRWYGQRDGEETLRQGGHEVDEAQYTPRQEELK